MKFDGTAGGGASDDEPQIGEPRQQLLEEHAQLEAREARAEAEVRAEAEGDVRVRVARGVEAERIGEDALVAIRRRVEQQQLVARADALAAQRRVARGGAVHVLDRRHPAQHLLDGDRDPAADRRASARIWSGLRHSASQPPAQHVARRLVAADQDQQSLLQQVVVREASRRRSRPRRARSSGRRAASRADRRRRGGCRPRTRRTRAPPRQPLRASRSPRCRAISSSDQRCSIAAILRLDAEQVADQDHRQRRRDLRDEVAASLAARSHRSARGTSARIFGA